MKDKVRWGILGTGNIAGQFAQGLTSLPDAELVAVGSRAKNTAHSFADSFDIPHAHADYQSLAADPDVDVVYIATPHPFHMENTLLCLDAGKAVLCEKPFAVNADQAEKMIDAAAEKKLFLAEAMWMRFLPVIAKVRNWLNEDAIGQVTMLKADFGFEAPCDPNSRAFDPNLAGGALLDVGVYTVSLASMVFGSGPAAIASMAHIGETGVDERSAIIFGYDDGALAVLTCAVTTDTINRAVIYGSNGRITIGPRFYCPTQATLSMTGESDQTIDIPLEGNGYNYQAAEVANCLRAGKLQTDIMPLKESLAILETMDKIRTQWKLKYPFEE